MRRLSKAGKIVVGLASLGILLSLVFVVPFLRSAYEEVAVMAAKEQKEIIEPMQSQYPGIHLETLSKDTKKYVYAMSSPTIEGEGVNEVIQEWLTSEKEHFVKESKEIGTKEKQSTLNIQLETSQVTEHVYSLVFEKYVLQSGAANGQTTYHPYIVDIENQKILTIKDFIVFDEENSLYLKQMIREKIQENPDLAEAVFTEELDATLENLETLKWSLDKDSLHVHWNQHEISIGAVGPIQLSIPLTEVGEIVTEQGKEQLGIVVEEAEVLGNGQASPAEKLKADEKYVALTFDDGPHASVTPQILNTLKERHVRATFYMLGIQMDYYPDLVRQIDAEGHEIGNHSNTHIDFTKVSGSKVKEELAQTDAHVVHLTGKKPATIRPPYGAYNSQVLDIASQSEQSIVLWSVDSLDWKSRNPLAINQKIMSTVSNGSIILLHDIHQATADALPTLLSNLESEGYEFVTVTQLLEWKEETGVGPHF